MHNNAIKHGHFGFLSALGWLCHFTPKLQSSQNAAYVRCYAVREMSKFAVLIFTFTLMSCSSFQEGELAEANCKASDTSKNAQTVSTVRSEHKSVSNEGNFPCPTMEDENFNCFNNGRTTTEETVEIKREIVACDI